MAFYYVMELSVSEQRASYLLNNVELMNFVKSKRCELFYESGALKLKFPENEDLDEDVMREVLRAIKTPVNARQFIFENGAKIETFSGRLDPEHPLGQVKEEIQERTIESMEEEEEVQLKGSLEDLIDEMDEELEEE